MDFFNGIVSNFLIRYFKICKQTKVNHLTAREKYRFNGNNMYKSTYHNKRRRK
jgi:hypothetical protein